MRKWMVFIVLCGCSSQDTLHDVEATSPGGKADSPCTHQAGGYGHAQQDCGGGCGGCDPAEPEEPIPSDFGATLPLTYEPKDCPLWGIIIERPGGRRDAADSVIDAIDAAPNGSTIHICSGRHSLNGEWNNEIDKTLVFEGHRDAELFRDRFDNRRFHAMFAVDGGATLTVRNLKLTSTSGGLAAVSGSLELDNVEIEAVQPIDIEKTKYGEFEKTSLHLQGTTLRCPGPREYHVGLYAGFLTTSVVIEDSKVESCRTGMILTHDREHRPEPMILRNTAFYNNRLALGIRQPEMFLPGLYLEARDLYFGKGELANEELPYYAGPGWISLDCRPEGNGSHTSVLCRAL